MRISTACGMWRRWTARATPGFCAATMSCGCFTTPSITLPDLHSMLEPAPPIALAATMAKGLAAGEGRWHAAAHLSGRFRHCCRQAVA